MVRHLAGSQHQGQPDLAAVAGLVNNQIPSKRWFIVLQIAVSGNLDVVIALPPRPCAAFLRQLVCALSPPHPLRQLAQLAHWAALCSYLCQLQMLAQLAQLAQSVQLWLFPRM